MLKKKLIYIVFVSFIITINIFAQSQDPPTEEDLKRHIIKRQLSDISEINRWELKVEYPELRLAGDKPAVGFNNLSKSIAKKRFEEFKKTMSEFTEEDRKTLPEGMSYSMEVSYSIELLNDDFISIIFGQYEFTGGAHPNSSSFTLNYDLKNDRELQLKDLFKPNANFLKVISQNSIQQISKEQGEYADNDWIKDGAGEDYKNFESWSITKKGLKFLFDPYQVGPYAAGAFETILPYEKFTLEMQSAMFYRFSTVSYIDGNPANWCRNGLFTNQKVEFKLAKVKGKKNSRTYFYGDDEDCPNGTNCRKNAYLIAGDEVITSRTYGDFVCVWYQPQKGGETVGWIPVDNLTKQAPLKPGNVNWIGEWLFAENSITINPGKANGTYMIKGNAFWKGVGDNIHIGELDFLGTPSRNLLNSGDGKDKYDCRVQMQRIGKYLIVSDNKMCGGLNVSFDGVYIIKAMLEN